MGGSASLNRLANSLFITDKSSPGRGGFLRRYLINSEEMDIVRLLYKGGVGSQL